MSLSWCLGSSLGVRFKKRSTNVPTHDTPCFPPKCFISFVFSILRDDSNNQKKLETMVTRNVFLGGGGGGGGFFLRQMVTCLRISLGSYVWVQTLPSRSKSSPNFPGISFAFLSLRKIKGPLVVMVCAKYSYHK